MFAAFDRVYLDVSSIPGAIADYTALLGVASAPQGDIHVLSLANLDLCLRAGAQATRIAGLNLLDPDLDDAQEHPLATGDIPIHLGASCFRAPEFRRVTSATGIYAVDHLVLQTRNAGACITLFRDQLGLRLALDQNVPEWGGRMLFFRHGKMTLEVIERLDPPPPRDFFWGITFLCEDIDVTLAQLDARGVQHSPARPGRKPGTRVATIKSHAQGLPTLIVGPG